MSNVDSVRVDGVAYGIQDGGAVRFDAAQSLTDTEKTRARSNIGAASDSELTDVVRYTSQSKSAAQKTQARTNIGAQETLTFDNSPTSGSSNPVKSGGVYTALQGKQNTLTFDNTPTANSSNPVKSGGIKTAIDGALASVATADAGKGVMLKQKNTIAATVPEFTLYGKATQVRTEKSINLAKPTETASTTDNGVTYTYNAATNTITASGTATNYSISSIDFLKFDLPAGQYRIKDMLRNADSGVQIYVAYPNGSATALRVIRGYTDTITIETGGQVYIRMHVEPNTTVSNKSMQFMVVSGSTEPTEFVPYREASPTPANHSPISIAGGAGSIVVRSTNGNLFNPTYLLGAEGWTEQNGIYSGDAEALFNRFNNAVWVPSIPDGTRLTISGRALVPTAITSPRFVFQYSDGSLQNVNITTGSSFTSFSGVSAQGKTVSRIAFTYSSGSRNMSLTGMCVSIGTKDIDVDYTAPVGVTLPLPNGNMFNMAYLLGAEGWAVQDGVYTGDAEALYDQFQSAAWVPDIEAGMALTVFGRVQIPTAITSPRFVIKYTSGADQNINIPTGASFVDFIGVSDPTRTIRQVYFTYSSGTADISFADLRMYVAPGGPKGLPGFKVSSGGNYTDTDGQQWWCDTIDSASGKYTRRVGEIILDGTQTYTFSTTIDGGAAFYADLNTMVRTTNYTNLILCDALKAVANHNVAKATLNSISGYLDDGTYPGENWLCFCVEGVSTVADVTAYLKEHPITVLYALAVPVTENITAAQASAMNALRSFDVATVLYTMDAEQPEMSAAMCSDLATRIAALEDCIEAICEAHNALVSGTGYRIFYEDGEIIIEAEPNG